MCSVAPESTIQKNSASLKGSGIPEFTQYASRETYSEDSECKDTELAMTLA